VSGSSTRVLEVARGRPAGGVEVRLERRGAAGWHELRRATTDDDGRVSALLPADRELEAGSYRLTFELAAYFARLGVEAFYPEATIVFEVRRPSEGHHVPLLLSPFGYSTYRGS